MATAITQLTIVESGSAIAIAWDDGCVARFHAIWLRDNAQDPATRDAGSGQRKVTVLDLDPNIAVARAGLTDAGALQVTFAPGRHQASFESAWLRDRIYDRPRSDRPGWTRPWIRRWDGRLMDRLPRASHRAVTTKTDALAGWLDSVRRYGFSILTDVPAEPGAIERVVALFGYVRETNYGRTFDVRTEVDPVNLAYTGLPLQVHTDNPYRDPVPTLQLLHCLDSDAGGGDSVVVDGFEAVAHLAREAPDTLALLARHSVPFAFTRDNATHLAARGPMIELSPEGELKAVRFNNRSAAPFDLPYEAMADFYAAYRRFAAILERPTLAVTFKLAAGDLFVVDNRRVLHGRTGYAGAGTRHLQGCYADIDSLLSTLAVLEARRNTERETVV